MVDYIDQHKAEHGVEPICNVLPIAPSTYYDHKAKQRQPEKRSSRAKRDDVLNLDIQRIWEENFCVYGVRKIWRQLKREDIDVARCTVERLMKILGLRGVVRGRRIKTTLPSNLAERPLDLVNRDFKATRPNELWVAYLTYVATWRGFVYVAFIVDAFARRIVGWRVDANTRMNGPAIDYDYDDVGNLLLKDDYANSYIYQSGKPNAPNRINLKAGGSITFQYDNNGNRTHENGNPNPVVTYNSLNKPIAINRGGSSLSFSYGPSENRYKQVADLPGSAMDSTLLYIDSMSQRETFGGEVKDRLYIDGIAVITLKSVSTNTIVFNHLDRLGSPVARFDSSGVIVEARSFDPFGKPREGDLENTPTDTLDGQHGPEGFTGHEHLDSVQLIHMNGRGYDYQSGQFLSVDPYIAGGSQGVNAYSYVRNNPLSFTDPTGYACEGSRLRDCGGEKRLSEREIRENKKSNKVATENWAQKQQANADLTNSINNALGLSRRDQSAHIGQEESAVTDESEGYVYDAERGMTFFEKLGSRLSAAPQGLVDSTAGFGDTLSFGLTNLFRWGAGVNDSVNFDSGYYSSGEAAGVTLSLAFGGAHLGRNALYAKGKKGTIGLGIKRLFSDTRGWNSVRSMWSKAAGNGKVWLKENGVSLHHWAKPQRFGKQNAGFNYIPISAKFNSWMNGSTRLKSFVEARLRPLIGGIYGAPLTATTSNLVRE